jgi:hypothetical protein
VAGLGNFWLNRAFAVLTTLLGDAEFGRLAFIFALPLLSAWPLTPKCGSMLHTGVDDECGADMGGIPRDEPFAFALSSAGGGLPSSVQLANYCPPMIFFRFCLLLPLALAGLLLSSCGTTANSEQMDARRAAIAAEPRGDYYIGRRFHIDRTQFWGYLRKPGQDWMAAKLVIMGEQQMKTPDRLSEAPTGDAPAVGFDHNTEYRIWGHFSGKKLYDPNSNLILPEFVLQRYQRMNDHPGWLFRPNERFNGEQLLRAEPEALP